MSNLYLQSTWKKYLRADFKLIEWTEMLQCIYEGVMRSTSNSMAYLEVVAAEAVNL
jgi:hypothetical protein